MDDGTSRPKTRENCESILLQHLLDIVFLFVVGTEDSLKFIPFVQDIICRVPILKGPRVPSCGCACLRLCVCVSEIEMPKTHAVFLTLFTRPIFYINIGCLMG